MIRTTLFRLLLLALYVSLQCSLYAQDSTELSNDTPVITNARVGFNGLYKLGCWTPIEVEIAGGASSLTGQLIATVPDSDSVPVSYISPRPVGLEPGETTKSRFVIRVGQTYSQLNLSYVVDGKEICKRKLYPGPDEQLDAITSGLDSTYRLLLEFGPALDLVELIQGKNGQESNTYLARIDEASNLPTNWFAYEGVDTILITTSNVQIYRPLFQNRARIEALREWVENGGKLVVFCGANGEELLSKGGPLADLVPGTYVETTKLRSSQPLEAFCNADQPISPDRRLNVSVPLLKDVQGQIVAHGGNLPTDLPLVVRSRLGFGELVFIGLDFDSKIFRDWKSHISFLKKAIHWEESFQEEQENYGYPVDYAPDLSSQIRDALESKFAGVETVSFGVVAFLVGIYIALIGPGDFFLVKKLLRRTELTWLTFPLIVVGVSAGAYWFANWMKGDQLRVNQLEIVDVDVSTGQVRGTAWTHFFTPRVDEFNLTYQPKLFHDSEPSEVETLATWLGMPGSRMGGMQSGNAQASLFEQGYMHSTRLDELMGLPVQLWSTKTLTSRWQAYSKAPLSSELNLDGDVLEGFVTNNGPLELEDCHLLFGWQAYHLGRLLPGRQIIIDDSKLPRRLKTLLTNASAGDETERRVADDGTVQFSYAQQDVARLAKLAMFYEAIDGNKYSNLLHEYQAFLDLSHLLDYKDIAILLCRVSGSESQWYDDEEPLGSDQDRTWTYYRFLLPVEYLKTEE